MSPWDRNCSSHGTAACVEESKVPQSRVRVSPSSCFEEEGKDQFIFLLFPPSTLLSVKHPCLQWNSWDWRVISHKDQEEHFWFLSITHDSFAFFKWLILSPLQCLDPALCQIVLFSKDVRQERKRSLLFSSLYIQSLPAWLPLFFQRGKDRIHCFCFSTGTIQLLFSMSQNTTDEHQHSELTKGQGRASKIHYLQEIGGSFYKFCAR